ncbi:MAG: HWE histidine kinase domain-containing protein [Henriciella sp.]
MTTHQGLPPEAVFLNFRKLLDNILTPYMVMDRDLVIIYANNAFFETVDRSPDDIIGRYIFDSFPEQEERVAAVREIFLETLNGGVTRLDRQFFDLEQPDGTKIPKCWQCVQTPYFDSTGEVRYIVQHAEDVTEAVKLESKNEMIAKELDHRVKNIFAVVQSVAVLSGQRADSSEHFREDFSNRLAAMSRTYDALSRTDWSGLLLADIFKAELKQYADVPSDRVSISGPAIRFGPKASQNASLYIHELATNAAKYGCFSSPHGKLDISWKKGTGSNLLEIVWSESGLSGIKAPTELGFGSQIPDFMPNINVERVYRDDGLLVRTTVPIAVIAMQQSVEFTK